MIRTLLPVFILSFIQPLTAQDQQRWTGKKMAPETVKADFSKLISELSEAHPGFYRFHSRASMLNYCDSISATITDSLTSIEAYRKFKPVIARIGCLHTGIRLSAAASAALDSTPTLLPLQLHFSQNTATVVSNFSPVKALQPGDEIIAVNGKTIPELLAIMLPHIPGDGYNLTMKYRALYYSFPLWYRTTIAVTDSFKIVARRNGQEQQHLLRGALFNDIASGGFLKEAVPSRVLDFNISDSIAYMTVKDFSRSAGKRSHQRHKRFFRKSFRALRKNKINNLVLDLRDNTGGTDANAAYLSSFFFDKPYRYWDRIEVMPAIARQIKGLQRLFYRKPQLHDGKWLWQRGRTTKEFNFAALQYPQSTAYRGKTYVLINGFCMSSCSDLAAVLAHNKKAVFVGEETGGGYTGNNSGMMPVMSLPNTGFRVTIPLLAYYNAVDTTGVRGTGVLPNYRVSPTAEDLIRKKDVTLDAARMLIAAGIY